MAFPSGALAQPASADGVWLGLPMGFPREVEGGDANVRPVHGSNWQVDVNLLRDKLLTAPMEDTPEAVRRPLVLELPLPDGRLYAFTVVNSPVMDPELARKVPEVVGTYFVRGVEDPTMSGRIDLTAHGYHGMIFTDRGTAWTDPYTKREPGFVVSYWKQDYEPTKTGFRCLVDEHTPNNNPEPPGGYGAAGRQNTIAARSGANRRTYRLAIAATGEWTAVNGGTAALGQATLTTAANRVTGIYERDFGVRVTLVANNINLVYTNGATDPYTNGNASTLNTQNQTNVDAVIGTANYDVAHIVSTGGENGLAGAIGNVCVASGKAQGASLTTSVAMADAFTVDYIAHEMGHQFGGRHNFGSCSGSQGDSSSLAVEPGSGSTIMGYAGICPSSTPTAGDNVQAHSDDYFNVLNIDQVVTYTTSGSGSGCGTSAATGNNPPTVSAGLDYSIPFGTPFTLTATGSDPDGNALTYCWEQADGGAVRTLATQTVSALAVGPIVRSRLGTSSPSRQFPAQANLLANTTLNTELLPAGARTMNFRVTARDGLGGVWDDAMVLTVASSGPFQVTAPNSAVSLSGNTTVTWNVAGTTGAPVSCANVRILLSTDGGATYPTVLAASTPNDGTELVTLPSITTSTARIRIEAVGNIFFDISNANFSISPSVPVVNLALGTTTLSDTAPNGNANGRADPGESNLALTLQVVNNGGLGATGVTGTLSSLTATASVAPASATQPYPNLGPSGGSGVNASPYIVAVDGSHPCGTPINLRLTVNATGQAAKNFDFSLPVGIPGGTVSQTFSYTGPAVTIPTNATAVNVNLPVSGFAGLLSDVNFRFDGASCSTNANSTTVGLNHSWVGDLVITLTSPHGTAVTLMNRPGGGSFGSSGNNFCQTVLDDAGANSIQAIVSTNAPHTGTWAPASPLAAFNGEDPNGTWVLTVLDAYAPTDFGTLRSFSLILGGNSAPVCDPPIATGGCNIADITEIGGTADTPGNPDNQLTVDDIIVFTNLYSDGTGCPGAAPCSRADVTGIGGVGAPPDGQLTVDDIIEFFNAFSNGC